MKKYRLKEEVKKYLNLSDLPKEPVTDKEWLEVYSITFEALEEVEERIELELVDVYNCNDVVSVNLKKKYNNKYNPFTNQEKQLCEAILNASESTKEAVLNSGDIVKELNDLRDFAVWMTGCGFDFSDLAYFQENKHLLRTPKN